MKAIDLFAGTGGFTLGAEQAGCNVLWAANHWPLAVQGHAANHPNTVHACQDLRQADWSLLPDYDLLLASPACQGHSSASQPKRRRYHDAMRATAWAVVDCAEVTTPKALIVENVPSFMRWQLYPLWRQALEQLGYHLTEQVIRASDHGVPQRRDRLFIVGSRKAPVELGLSRTPEAGFGKCIEWDAGRWRRLEDIAPGARARIEKASKNHSRRFLTQHVTGHPGVALSEPIRTITTKDQWGVVRGKSYRPLTTREYARAMGFPDTYRWPQEATRGDTIKLLGNAVCPPVAKALVARVAEVTA